MNEELSAIYMTFNSDSTQDQLGRDIYHWFRNSAASMVRKERDLTSMMSIADSKTKVLLAKAREIAREVISDYR